MLIAGTVESAPGSKNTPKAKATDTLDPSLLDGVEQAWSAGRYKDVREQLEPIANSSPLSDPLTRDKVLTYLADATVNDLSLPEDVRRDRAAQHLERLMNADNEWQLPRDVFSPELNDIYVTLLMQRAQSAGDECRASLIACHADVDNFQADIARREAKYAELNQKYQDQPVQIRDVVARSRFFAAIPFGVGQFYNGDRALGGTFLGLETGFGVAGLSLLIYRVTADGCTRTNGFQTGSLQCSPRRPTTQAAVVRRRQAEEAMAWLFLGTVVLDIVIAQIRFRPFKTTNVRFVPRRELDSSESKSSESGRRWKRRKPARKARAKVVPGPGVVPGGGGVGVHIRF